MVEIISEDIFNLNVDAIVNPVNTEGIMGKGLAAEMKKRFPAMFNSYRNACIVGNLAIGKVHSYKENDTLIINFPTKKYWRSSSNIGYIKDGLKALAEFVVTNNLSSIAIPALGCGLGGLDWRVVKVVITDYLNEAIPDCKVLLIEPK